MDFNLEWFHWRYYSKGHFDAEKAIGDCTQWIECWFRENGSGCRAIVGMSGGKDSTVCAALCAEVLGAERVLGVLLPRGAQGDIADAREACEAIGIPFVELDIAASVDGIEDGLGKAGFDVSRQASVNLPARIRMAALYAVSQSVHGRVANTCNLSEDWVGYSTRYGDSAGDFSPLGSFTVSEVKAIGRCLGLPQHLIDKQPSDGLSGMTDEEALGFPYSVLDNYIRHGIEPPEGIKSAIDTKHCRNLFKLKTMPVFGR